MSVNMSVNNKEITTTEQRLIGRVKWFNHKSGYGFITISNGEHTNTDIFVHHSNINVSCEQYKYLVEGEYVEFDMVDTDKGTHKVQASDVCGINRGTLMCETINKIKKEKGKDKEEWYVVHKKKNKK